MQPVFILHERTRDWIYAYGVTMNMAYDTMFAVVIMILEGEASFSSGAQYTGYYSSTRGSI